mmetsp:Transcript_56084/g.122877  ORF Transcript_56084/g.122877 Transcript_56084/m.122877 type:complete len:167 (-) Transcript_56084:907-1407(-)
MKSSAGSQFRMLATKWVWVTGLRSMLGAQAVARRGSKMLSVFDGVTEYSLNQLTVAHRNQLYVYPTHNEARSASFPTQSKLNGARMLVLKVLCYGPGRCSGRKWAFHAVLPIAVVDDASPPFRCCVAKVLSELFACCVVFPTLGGVACRILKRQNGARQSGVRRRK